MGAEALLGTQANYASFISSVRPHPGQVCLSPSNRHHILCRVKIEASATLYHLLESSSLATSSDSQQKVVGIAEDAGKLRQDRYALRTAPQWIGPLIEDIMSAVHTTEIECNSSTCLCCDQPIISFMIEPQQRIIHWLTHLRPPYTMAVIFKRLHSLWLSRRSVWLCFCWGSCFFHKQPKCSTQVIAMAFLLT